MALGVAVPGLRRYHSALQDNASWTTNQLTARSLRQVLLSRATHTGLRQLSSRAPPGDVQGCGRDKVGNLAVWCPLDLSYLCLNSEITDVPIPNVSILLLVGFPRIALWYSRLQVQSPRNPFGIFVLDPQLPPGVLCLGTVLLILLWHVARRRAVPLLRCGTSSLGPKSTAKSKVRCDPFFPFAHGTFILPFKSPLSLSLHPLVLQTPFFQTLFPQPLVPQTLVLQTLLPYTLFVMPWLACRLPDCRCNLWGVIQLLTMHKYRFPERLHHCSTRWCSTCTHM